MRKCFDLEILIEESVEIELMKIVLFLNEESFNYEEISQRLIQLIEVQFTILSFSINIRIGISKLNSLDEFLAT